MNIGSKKLGPGEPTFIVAELSGNHGGELEKALLLVDAAAEIGADAIKLQTYTADTITLKSSKPDFQILSDTPWKDHSTLYDLYSKAFTPWEWHAELFSRARAHGMEVFSSPFDSSSVDFLESLKTPAYKIASPEITDLPLLRRVAQTGKPVIVSTGLAEEEDIVLAVSTLREAGVKDLVLLKCTTAYPAPLEEANLKMIPELSNRFECLSGLSDHTLGSVVPLGAVALGAQMIEKHLVMNRSEETVDSFFSLTRDEFAEMVCLVRDLEKAMGRVDYSLGPQAQGNFKARRSLYVSAPILKGEVLSLENIRSVRPGFGLHPKYLTEVIGRRVTRDLEAGDRLDWEWIEGEMGG